MYILYLNAQDDIQKLKYKTTEVYNIGDSQVVTHHSTNPTQHCLTSVIR